MRIYRHQALISCLSALAVAALATGAEAQVTSAQQSAIKANCRSDFMSKCSGVTPGGQEALACLQKNVSGLSAACKSAVSATLPPPPAAPAAASAPATKPAEAEPAATTPPAPAPQPAAAPTAPVPAAPPKAAIAAPPKAVVSAAAPTAAQQNAMKQACRSDFMAKCSGVTPGGKDALACLQRNVSTLSPSCKQVVSATMGGAPAATPTAAPAAAAPTAAQQSAMKQACRSDFMAKCAGVTPGGKDALACLQRNVSTLSPSCKQVVSATMGAPAATAAAPAAAVAAPAAGPTPEQLKAVKFTCRGDFQRYCRGMQPGGPEAIMCLQTNAARLTPDCKTSLADIADSVPASAATAAAAAAPAAAAATPARRLPPAITPAGRIIRRVIERNH